MRISYEMLGSSLDRTAKRKSGDRSDEMFASAFSELADENQFNRVMPSCCSISVNASSLIGATMVFATFGRMPIQAAQRSLTVRATPRMRFGVPFRQTEVKST